MPKSLKPDFVTTLTDKQTQKDSDFFNIKSPELYINMDPKKIPPYSHPDFIAFGNEEKRKCREGVNINGQYIPGSLYYSLGFHTIQLDAIDSTGKVLRPASRPYLRDNDWIIHNDYHRAQKERLAFLIGGSRQIAKDLLNTSVLYTPTGEIQIGNARVGQQIYDADGKLTTITGVYPQGIRPVYKMTLADGRELFCGLDHNWYVEDSTGQRIVKTTKDLLSSPTDYSIPICNPVEFPGVSLPVYLYQFGKQCSSIPELYKYCSIAQRIDLWYGILSSVEHCEGLRFSGNYISEFVLKTKSLVDDLTWIIRSLGKQVRVETKDNGYYFFIDSYTNATQITDIQYVFEAETTCISVDNEDHLYLTDGFTVTHNTDTLVSLACRELFIYEGAEVMGLFSISNDKDTFNKKISIALNDGSDLWATTRQYIEPRYWPERHPNFLVIPNIDKDLKKSEIRFGLTKKNNEIVKLSTLYTYLTDGGVNDQSGAGKSLTFFFFDEIAKYPCKAPYEAVKPALLSEYGMRCAAFLSFTGGNVEKGKDAIDMFTNPKANTILPFENEGKLTGKFMGGWYRQDFKYKTTLTKYLGIADKGELSKMEIRITDFDLANKKLDEELENALNDNNPQTAISLRTYYPRSIADMSTTVTISPFQKFREGLERHQVYLLEHKPGTPYKVFRTPDKKVHLDLSDKRAIANFPHKPNVDELDAPVIVYDRPKHETAYKLHVGGLDPYHTGTTETSPSLGAFYLFRRNYGNLDDAFQDTMVLSYVARPDSTNDFFEVIHNILDLYGATMLHENSNDMVLNFFDKQNKAEQYLAKTWSLQKEINPNTRAQNTYGLSPTVPNKRAMMNRIVEYLSEIVGIDANEKPILGYTRILDPVLIQEMLEYKDGVNVDRIVGFGHALMYMDYLDKNEKPEIPVSQENKPIAPRIHSPFGFTKHKLAPTTKRKSVFLK